MIQTPITKRTLDFNTRPKLRLSEIERLIRAKRIIMPPPSRRKLLTLCEDGTFETAPRNGIRSHYLVYEDSFLKWLQGMDGE